jgi:hypothetical protein
MLPPGGRNWQLISHHFGDFDKSFNDLGGSLLMYGPSIGREY